MKNTINIISIISILLAAFALLTTVVGLFFFWEPLCALFYTSGTLIESGPIIPIGTVTYMICALLTAVIIYVGTKWDKICVIEIISIISLGVVIPVLDFFVSRIQYNIIGHTQGSEAIIALSTSASICAITCGLTKVAVALCLVVCGMSISEKIHQKNI